MLAHNIEHIYNHRQLVSKNSYFKFKIIKTQSKYFMVGICGKNIKNATTTNAYNSPYFMGYYLATGNYYMNKTNKAVTGVLPIT